jgi:negative modulator of initiation of replication
METQMRAVDLDEDVYGHLLKHTEFIGESASSILRRLLDLPAADRKSDSGFASSGNGVHAGEDTSSDPLLQYLQSDRFRFLGNATDRYLALLSFAHERDAQSFAKVLDVSGRKRKYFARNRADIANSGKSTHPQQIPGSPYWAMTNADNQQKRQILKQALRRLGYGTSAVSAACRSLE